MVDKFYVYFSPAGEHRRIHLYLPDDYHRTEEHYPVIYMFDGHNLYFDSDATAPTLFTAASMGISPDAETRLYAGSLRN